MNNNCVEVDELILEIADYKNDLADMAAEKLLRKCSTSWEAPLYAFKKKKKWCRFIEPAVA
jgi:hypothetical protein